MYKSKTVLPECIQELLQEGTTPNVREALLLKYLWETQQKLESQLTYALEELKEWERDQAPYGCGGYDKLLPEMESELVNSKWVSTQLGGSFDHSKPTKEDVQELIEEGYRLCDSLEGSIDKIAERGSE